MNTKRIIFKVLSIVFWLGITSNVFGIGMITEPIIIENMLREGEIMKTVTVLNPEKEKAVYSFGTEGDIKGWATFFETNDLEKEITKATIPASAYYDVMAKIKVPAGTPNGQYNGEIFVKQEPKQGTEQEKNTVSISQMVSREVRITVTDKEVIDFEITVIPKEYDVKIGEPLQIKIIYENKGNVSIKPDIQLKIIKDENMIFNAIFPYPESENPVVPGERKTMPDFEWQTQGQKPGKYKAEIDILLNNKKVGQDGFKFNVDMNVNPFLATISRIRNENLATGWFVIAGFFLMIAVILRSINKKRSSLKKKQTLKVE